MDIWYKNGLIALVSSIVIFVFDALTNELLSEGGGIFIFLCLWILFNQLNGKKTTKNN